MTNGTVSILKEIRISKSMYYLMLGRTELFDLFSSEPSLLSFDVDAVRSEESGELSSQGFTAKVESG